MTTPDLSDLPGLPELPELIDSHCHIFYDFAPKSPDDLVREAKEAGVSHLIIVGTELENIATVEALSDKYECAFHTVGVHPHDAVKLRDEDLAVLEKASHHPKCRAIGEIGLDYHYNHSAHDIQISRLDLQLDLASRRGLPVVIHSRDAEADLLQSLRRYATQVREGVVPGVIHCFTGTREFGLACLELGFYISFSGILTFKNAEDLRSCAKEFPLDRLLVETDSPYLAPIPHRGRKCEPSMVRFTAQKLAEVRGIPLKELAAATTANSRRVFGLPTPDLTP